MAGKVGRSWRRRAHNLRSKPSLVLTSVALAVAMLASLLAFGPVAPAAAAPGDSVIIWGPDCVNGAGEVLFQVNNDGDQATELTFSVGPYTRDQTVPANTNVSYPIGGIADGTYNAQAFFFISEVASKQVTIDCAPDPLPLLRPSVSTAISGNTLTFSWPAVSQATKYDYRITDDGTQIEAATNVTGRSHTFDLGSRTGNICVYVTAKAAGIQSSREGSSCKTKDTLPALARPAITTSIAGSALSGSWGAVPGATKYDVRVTDDGTEIYTKNNHSGRSISLNLGTRTGNICVFATAKASGRQSSVEGSSCKTRNAARLATPSVSTTISGSTVTLSWASVSGATKYDYRITDDGTTIETVTNTTGRIFDFGLGSRTGNICVFVTAKASGRQPSVEGSACRTKNAVRLAKPSVTTTLSGSTLSGSWPAVSGAAMYDYRITDDGTQIESVTNYTGRSFSFGVGSRTGNICVFVTAKASGRQPSIAGSSCKTKNAVQLATPTVATTISGSALGFFWSAVPGATKYDYRITDDGTTIKTITDTTGQSFVFDLGSRTGNICVFVTAKANGRQSSAEGSACRTRNPARLTTPSISTSMPSGAISFSWAAVPGATKYDYRITDDGTTIKSIANTTGRSHTYELGSRSGKICVYVTAKASGRESSSAGSACRTKVARLATPSVTSSMTANEFTFAWHAVSGATKYDYYLTDDGARFNSITNTTGRVKTVDLGSRHGTICAYVTAKGDRRDPSTPGSTCKEKEAPPRLSSPSITTTVNSSKVFSASWSSVLGATTYDYRITDDGTDIRTVTDTTRRSVADFLGTKTGNICIHVTAKAAGRQSSTESSSCKVVNEQLPLPSPVIHIDINGSVMVYQWGAITGATKYDFRVTDDGTVIRDTKDSTGRAFNMSLVSRSGHICVFVVAKADGRQSSAEASACQQVADPNPLPTPSVTASVTGTRLTFGWPTVTGATKYDYRVTDDGSRTHFKLDTRSRSHTVELGSSAGRICAYATAKSDTRQASRQGVKCLSLSRLATPTPTVTRSAVVGEPIRFDWPTVVGAEKYSTRVTFNGSHYLYFNSPTSDLTRTVPLAGEFCIFVTAVSRKNTTRVSSSESTSRACVTVTKIAKPEVESWMKDDVLHFRIRPVAGASKYTWFVPDASGVDSGSSPTAGDYPVDLSDFSGTTKCILVSAKVSDDRGSNFTESCNLVSTMADPELRYNWAEQAVEVSWPRTAGAWKYRVILKQPNRANVEVEKASNVTSVLIPVDERSGREVCVFVQVNARDATGDYSDEVCVDTVVTAETLGLSSPQANADVALNRIAEEIGLTGGMEGNPWLSGSPQDLSTMKLRTLSDVHESRLKALVAEVGYQHFEAFLKRADTSLRRSDVSYGNYLYRMLPLSYIVGDNNPGFQSAVGGLDIDPGSVVTMTVDISGIGAGAYAGPEVFVGTARGSAVFAGLTLAVGGTFLIQEIVAGEFGNSAQDIVEVAGLGISAITLVAALAGLGPIGLGVMAVVGLVVGVLSIFLPDRGRNDIELGDSMSVVDQKLFNVRKKQLEKQINSLQEIIPKAEARLEPDSCVDRDDRDGGYECFRETDHMFVLGSKDTATEVYVVHRFLDDVSGTWYGVIAVHPWNGPAFGWEYHIHELKRAQWESSFKWEDVVPVSTPTNGTIVRFPDVRDVLTDTQQALDDHITAGP